MKSSSKHSMKEKNVAEAAAVSAAQQLLRQLEQELLEHNEFFDMLVDMIPSKLYISGSSGDDFNPKYFKGTSSNENSKEARKVAAKAAKRRKLDPASVETTVKAKMRMEEEKEGSASDDEDDSAADAEMKKPVSTAAAVVVEAAPAAAAATGHSRIEALRAKLHAKIASKQGNRPAATAENAETISKRAARRAEKNRRKEEAKKRGKSTSTQVAASSSKTTVYKVTPVAAADPMQDLQTIDFGRLAGFDTINAKNKNYLETNKALQNLSKGKNLHKLLADAEAKRIKLEALKQSAAESDKAKAASMQWADTFKEADGVRVKDDPARLKKAIKRKDAVKRKSQKAWKARTDQVSEAAKNRQQIRQHNLKARVQGGAAGANLSSKKIAEKPDQADKGRRLSRAGFEGRKQDFLNSPKEGAGGKKKHQ